MKVTWEIAPTDGEADWVVSLGTLRSVAEAAEVKNEVQTIQGTCIEQDGAFLYAVVVGCTLKDIAKELEEHGHDWEEGS
jgi:hypothetical protein